MYIYKIGTEGTNRINVKQQSHSISNIYRDECVCYAKNLNRKVKVKQNQIITSTENHAQLLITCGKSVFECVCTCVFVF